MKFTKDDEPREKTDAQILSDINLPSILPEGFIRSESDRHYVKFSNKQAMFNEGKVSIITEVPNEKSKGKTTKRKLKKNNTKPDPATMENV